MNQRVGEHVVMKKNLQYLVIARGLLFPLTFEEFLRRKNH
jgi:hypothetical protein